MTSQTSSLSDESEPQREISTQLTSLHLKEILSTFKIRSAIGQGGQKTVYDAISHNGESVALKIGKYRSSNSLERLKREVEFLTNLDSPGIGKILTFHNDLDLREFLIIEPLHIAKPLNQCRALFNNELKARGLLINCFRSLLPVWEKRIVHRDLKPDNILIDRKFNPIIIDFGIARFLDFSSLTASSVGQGPCTPLYAAKEQLTNRKVEIDCRADFFSLGVIAAELICNTHPFDPDAVGNKNDIVENIIEGKYCLGDMEKVASSSFVKFIKRSLQQEPYLRFRTAEEALANLLEQ